MNNLKPGDFVSLKFYDTLTYGYVCTEILGSTDRANIVVLNRSYTWANCDPLHDVKKITPQLHMILLFAKQFTSSWWDYETVRDEFFRRLRYE